MRRILAAVLFALASGAVLQASPAAAQEATATFNFVNKARYTIFVKMYSNRNRVWPGPNEHYTLDDGQLHSYRLACASGEKICYGGAYLQDGTGSYWGIGFFGSEGCQDCCIMCGSTANYSLSE